MARLEKFIANHNFFIILILSLPAVWALFAPGFYGASDDVHIAWLYEMNSALSSGQFPPRYVPDLSFGFGYPLFNFVFPLPFYVGEIFHLIGFSFVDSIKAVFFLSVPLSAYFMYKFLNEKTGELLSLAGAAIYIYTPYRATDLYVRGAIGEIFAFIFLPLIALSLVKIIKTEKLRWAGILGFATSGLILSHNILSYMFFPFFLFLTILLIFFAKTRRIQILTKTFFGFVLGLLISAYFWIPAIIESRLVKYDTVFNFKDHFPTLKQLVTPYFGYGASVPGPYDGMSFFLGSVNLFLVLMAIYAIYKGKNIILGWALVSFSIAVFMMNFRSSFVWDSVPLLPYFQFPWRFLSLTTFVTSIMVISLEKIKYKKVLSLAIIALAIFLNSGDFKPNDFLGRKDAYYLNRYIPVPFPSPEYLKTSEEYLRLPMHTEVRPTSVSPHQGLSGSFTVNLAKDGEFNYYKYNFPGWEAKIDGRQVPIFYGKPFGQVTVMVPSGKHDISFSFRETTFRKFWDIISLLTILLGATIILLPPKVYEK